MKNHLIYRVTGMLCLFLFPLFCSAQFTDSFSDGDFTTNPIWNGTDSSFIINEALELQLKAANAGSAFLSTPSSAIEEGVWEFYVELDFNPSNQNYTKIYLASDKSDLSNPLNGFFIYVGGAEDEISLYKQKGEETIKLIEGQPGRVNHNKVKARIRAMRGQNGHWELLSAVGDTSSLVLEGQHTDTEIFSAHYFGVFCGFTSTRADKFIFDEFKVSGIAFADKIPPELTEIKEIFADKLVLAFSEPLDKSTAENAHHYQLRPDIGYPDEAIVHEDSSYYVSLNLRDDLKNGTTYFLEIKDLVDTVGNEMEESITSFLYFQDQEAKMRDLVINEFMADPIPVVGLPDAEYLELYNNSDHIFNLADWKISDDRTVAILRAHIMLPGDYLILTSPSDTSSFQSYGAVQGVEPWPSLNNEGDSISLTNASGDIIDQVKYNANWYKSSIRGDGGYALEMIDPSNPCSDEQNWKASDNRNGGTPGMANAVLANKPDLSAPELLHIFPLNSTTLQITFNESLDTATLKHAEIFINGNEAISDIMAIEDNRALILTIKEPLEKGKGYTLEASKVSDCSGNILDPAEGTLTFGLPEEADSMDIIINEILFDPRPDGVDFVEIYNNSKKYVNLKGWILANISREDIAGKSSEIIDNRKEIMERNFLFGPEEYLALTTSIAKTIRDYPRYTGAPMVEMASLPTYPNEAGHVVLLNNKNKAIDRLDYHEDFHSAILKDTEGVSLERISFEKPTQDVQNWTSAASSHSFATPGMYNSQMRRLNIISGNLKIDPKVVIPGNDGDRNFTTIQYNFKDHGNIANVLIYDSEGRIVKRLTENTTLATEGFFKWEGVDDEHNTVKVGIYMLYFRVYNLDGNVRVFKEPIAIGSSF